MERIKNAQLEHLEQLINEAAGQVGPLWQQVDGRNKATVGMYHIYSAYGSVGLHKMENTSGGCSVVIGLGTKRELYNQMRSFLDGMAAACDLEAS